MKRFLLWKCLGSITMYALLLTGLIPGAYAQSVWPLVVYEFDKTTMLENGWSEATGGFSGRPAGTAAPIAFPPGAFVSSQDQRGLAITVKPNEVAFVQTLFPLNTAGFPLLMRLTVRANAPEASIALAALRGNLNDMNGVDGSIATHVPASAASFMALERRIVLVYEPDSGELITPLIQVAATGQTGNVVVIVDKLEVLKLDAGEFGSNLTSSPDPTPTPTATPAAPQTITIDLPTLPADTKSLEMVLIPAGTFMMGSPDSEPDRDPSEGPEHQVTITRPFYMGKYEVTQAQWQTVMGSNPPGFKGNNLPVEQVSWNDCQTFIQKLNQLEQGTFRLPTEAEWEYACRAGTTTRFYWGDDPSYSQIGQYAWYGSNSSSQAHEVGTKLPNAWELYDMSGNVGEWCQDWCGDYPSSPQVDTTGAYSGSLRIIRGGSWFSNASFCRVALRDGGWPADGYYNIGFRVVLFRTQK